MTDNTKKIFDKINLDLIHIEDTGNLREYLNELEQELSKIPENLSVRAAKLLLNMECKSALHVGSETEERKQVILELINTVRDHELSKEEQSKDSEEACACVIENDKLIKMCMLHDSAFHKEFNRYLQSTEPKLVKDSEILDWSIENYERFRTFCYNIRSPELVRKRITKATKEGE
jgi:hypothetical protein